MTPLPGDTLVVFRPLDKGGSPLAARLRRVLTYARICGLAAVQVRKAEAGEPEGFDCSDLGQDQPPSHQ